MKVTSEKRENSQLVLKVEADPEEMERSLDEAYRQLAKRTDVPGFRRGKAPRVMLESYLGKEALREEALEQLVPQLLGRAIEEQGIDAISQPELEILQSEPVLIFQATVALRPSVELGDYRRISIAAEPVDVTEEEVEKALEDVRYQHAPWLPAERAVQFGDLVTIDVKGTLEGEPVLDRNGLEYQVLQDFPFPVPGFAENLVDTEIGREKEFTISFPADYERSELAGKEYVFRVQVSEIKEKGLPELDDEFARSLGQGLETVDALRQRVKSNLKAMAEERARKHLEEKAIQALVERSRVEFPPVLVEREIDRLVRERGATVEGHLRDRGKSEEELRGELRPLATERITRSLVLGKMAEEEGIEVTEAEIDEEVERMVQGAGEKGEEVRRVLGAAAARQSLEDALLTRKTIQRLVEIASAAEEEST